MTVSLHPTSGWALVISLYQSVAMPAQPRRQGGREEGKLTASPPSLSFTFSPSLPVHLCLSFSLRFLFCEGCVSSVRPHTTCDFQLHSFVPHPSAVLSPIGWQQLTVVFLCISASLSSVCALTRPHRWSADNYCPEKSWWCQYPHIPQTKAICPIISILS